MPFDAFDNKMKEAASQHHPAYDEKAWEKMEKLLDKHMPADKDNRRRWILFLLVFLFAGGGAWLLISQPWQKSRSTANVEANKPVNQTKQIESPVQQSDQPNAAQPSSINPDKVVEETITNNPSSPSAIDEGNNNNSTVSRRPLNITALRVSNSKPKVSQDLIIKSPTPALVKNSNQVEPTTENRTVKEQVTNQPDLNTKNIPEQKVLTSNNPVIKEKKIATPIISKPAETIAAASKAVTAASGVKKKSGFTVLFTAGPDLSASGTDKIGQVRFVLGAGLGYTFHDRLTLSTGFYSARKIYTASPGQYHPPAVFWTYYPQLKKVNADCKVYEIPVLLTYNFKSSSAHNWFVSTGLSSYLMKEENYDYFYKNGSGQMVDRKMKFTNVNKHFFSILDISGGYHRNINSTLSLSVEPYLRLPLDGIGYGKVKLNSGGVLFTIGVKPFAAVNKIKN